MPICFIEKVREFGGRTFESRILRMFKRILKETFTLWKESSNIFSFLILLIRLKSGDVSNGLLIID